MRSNGILVLLLAGLLASSRAGAMPLQRCGRFALTALVECGEDRICFLRTYPGSLSETRVRLTNPTLAYRMSAGAYVRAEVRVLSVSEGPASALAESLTPSPPIVAPDLTPGAVHLLKEAPCKKP